MVDRKEYRWTSWFSVVVVGFTLLPYLLGFSRQGEELAFTGFLFGVEDGNSYIAKMLYGAEGNWLFRTPYTNIEQKGALIYFPFLLFGKLSAPPDSHTQLVALYHIFRSAAAVMLVFATYDFLSVFLQTISLRRLGTAVAVLGGGAGWILLFFPDRFPGGTLPIEFYSPEAFGFLMVFGLPHLAFARACMLWALRDYLDVRYTYSATRNIGRTLLLWLGAGLMQPISLAIGGFAILLHLLLSGVVIVWRKAGTSDEWTGFFRKAVINALLIGPFFLYTVLVFWLDPFLRIWGEQNRLTSPPLFHYLLSYFVLLPMVVPGIRLFITRGPMKSWLVVGLAFAWVVLAYLPVSIQRRLVEGAWIALIILAFAWLEKQRTGKQKLLSMAMVLLFIPTIILWAGSIRAAWDRTSIAFRPKEEVAVFNYLAENANPNDVVLASYATSNALPAWAAVRTITGHGPESVHPAQMSDAVKGFYSTQTDAGRVGLLKQYQVKYVIWKRDLSPGSWDPRLAPYLSVVFQTDSYFLFKSDLYQ